jgi:hypothetical protein
MGKFIFPVCYRRMSGLPVPCGQLLMAGDRDQLPGREDHLRLDTENPPK